MTRLTSPTYSAFCNFLNPGRLLLVLLLLAVTNGCAPIDKEINAPLPHAGSEFDGGINTARLNLFLNLKDPNGPGIRLELNNLEVLADQVWLPVTSGPLQLDSEKIGATQVFLGGRAVPPGRYERLRFTVTKSSFRRGSGEYEAVAAEPYTLELASSSPIFIAKDDSHCMFVTWDLLESLERTEGLQPVMTIAFPLRQLFVDLLYVACPDIDTIFVIRSDKNWVADSFGIRGHPTYIAMDPDPSRQRLYILASRESRIKAVELNSQRIVDSFSIPLTREATFMTISPDGQWAYVLDERESYLSRLDLESGQLLAQVHLGYDPQYVTYLADRNILAVSFLISQTVSFHDPLNLNKVGSIPTGNSPEGLLAVDNRLYIAERGANTVSIFDLSTNMTLSLLSVGFGPRRLLNNGDQIYVSNYDSGSLSVIYPGQLEVGREIHGLGRPLEMILDRTNRWIYVGDERKAGLAIIDSNINQLMGYIEFGARPLGLAIIQNENL
jgi:DNA-binding beta-propeller fold protein YncE